MSSKLKGRFEEGNGCILPGFQDAGVLSRWWEKMRSKNRVECLEKEG
jgi:hypothetical protein